MTTPPLPGRSALQQRVATVILDAAAHVFAAGGESSMNEIAETAGVGRATLYRYFPNRQALWDEVAVVAVARISKQLQRERARTGGDGGEGYEGDPGLRRRIGDCFIVLTQGGAPSPPSPALEPQRSA